MLTSLVPSQCKVALLAGGTSGEREISLSSAKGAGKALETAGFVVTYLDPASPSDLKRLIDESFNVAFLCMHGKKGEDGVLQGFLELIDLPYTGSGVWASATAMDKAKSKEVYRKASIPTASSFSVIKGEEYDSKTMAQEIKGRCVVKPATEGSSLGIYIVEGEQAIRDSLDKVFEIDDSALVEQYIDGKELTVAVIGNEDPQALPIIEIIPQGESYDFDSKYAPGGSQHICPAALDEEITSRIQGLAVQAHQALGCRGMSRTDFILDKEGQPWALETNTIPGMTSTSLLPDAAKAAGITFPELCTRLVEFALEK
ncbi:D-alanine--D-alanine ligase [Adlercreutzia equolifaciens]|uniref:D-alanine--D-alanine ligase family protein n=1 Tax=Adlercreutzia equolifaciens TaxID=446660 RepID=UPI0023B121EA|nr:D-alanine--D-alanine ligase [Adlercreutzia equolifaciens]MDE8701620.1 D-alanine--D-alanine ligase [Adlercreutzia equolifaciens]